MIEAAIAVLSVAVLGMGVACLRAHAQLEAMRAERDSLSRDLKAFYRIHSKRLDTRKGPW